MRVKRYDVIKSGVIGDPFNLKVEEGDEIVVSVLLNAHLLIVAGGFLRSLGEDQVPMKQSIMRIPRVNCVKDSNRSMDELQKNKSMLYNRKKVRTK